MQWPTQKEDNQQILNLDTTEHAYQNDKKIKATKHPHSFFVLMEKKVKSLLSQLNNAIEIVRAIVIILKYAYLKAQTEEDAHSA